MHLIEASDVNEAAYKQCQLLYQQNRSGDSRNGSVLSVNRVLTRVNNITNRWLSLNGRNNSIIATIAEIMWILAGDNRIDTWLLKYLPRAIDYSDDGVSWRAGYGERIYAYKQLQSVINRLNESKDTRQAMIGIYMPQQDTDFSLLMSKGDTTTKDQPCNNLLYFFVEDGRLNLHVTCRSNDVIWGAWSINFQEFVILLEIVSQITGIPMGDYSVYQNNLHVYKNNEIAYSQFRNIVGNAHDKPVHFMSSFDIGSVSDQLQLQTLFSGLIEAINNVDETNGYGPSVVLDKFCIPPDSEIADWVTLITAYNYKKAGVEDYKIEIHCPNLQHAVRRDKFNSDLLLK